MIMNKEQKKIVEKAVEFNCKMLSVEKPKIKYLNSTNFLSPTTQSAISEDFSSLGINTDINFSMLDLWFVISHEIRHLWQKNNKMYLSDYISANKLETKKYNEQEAEIDAHAWAIVVITNLFGMRPTLEVNLGTEIWQKILDRAEKISDEMMDVL